MAPKFLLEAPAQYVDFGNSFVKAVALVVGRAVYQYMKTREVPATRAFLDSAASAAVSFFIYHMVVDRMLIRFVPKATEEHHYAAMKRFQ
jgi:hypothetical protein